MENLVSTAITEDYFRKLRSSFAADVALAGGGPSGLVAAALLAERGFSVNLYEKNISPGGGMWGGAMMFNSIVIEEAACDIASASGIRLRKGNESGCLADSVQATAALISRACSAGARVFNCTAVEDVSVDGSGRVNGVVVNWSPALKLGMYIDPLMARARCVLDATGHPAFVVTKFMARNPDGAKVPGEGCLNVLDGERHTVEHTGEVFPGLFVSGMSACAFGGGNRMGPVFGGMLLSGEKAAGEIAGILKNRLDQ